VLGNLLQLEKFEYRSSEEVHDEIKHAVDGILTQHHKLSHIPAKLPAVYTGIERIGEWPIYRIDNIVRRAPALQAIVINDVPAVRMSVSLANRLQFSVGDHVVVKEGQMSTVLPVELADNMPDDTVAIPLGFAETATLSYAFSVVTLQRSENKL
jgi:NADH-quinone oxidoreductase subunit G